MKCKCGDGMENITCEDEYFYITWYCLICGRLYKASNDIELFDDKWYEHEGLERLKELEEEVSIKA